MKNKRLIILISCIVLLVAIIVFCCNIFVLKKVNITVENNSSISTNTQKEICTNKVFKLNQNILFINKKNIVNTLEKEYPNLLISSIETQFPNTFLIHAEERKEVYYVKVNASSYISFDKTFKALNTYTDSPNLTQVIGVNADDVNVGEFLENSSSIKVAKDFYSSMYVCYYDEQNFVSLIRRIEIEDNYLMIFTNYNNSLGVTLKLENPTNNLTTKVIYAISALNSLDVTQKDHGTILVQEDLNNSSNLLTSYIK